MMRMRLYRAVSIGLACALAALTAAPADAARKIAPDSPARDTVLDRLRTFAASRSASSAVLRLESPLFSDAPLDGVYRSESDSHVRFRLAGKDLVVDLLQTGLETKFQLSTNAFRLTTDDLADDEYRRLRLLLGPLGTPLLSLSDLSQSLAGEYELLERMSGPDHAVFLPRAKFREILRAWSSFMTGTPPHSATALAPETVVLRFPAADTSTLEIEELTNSGHTISKLVFSFGPAKAPPPFRLPTDFPIIDNRMMMLALGAGPDWLVGKSVPKVTVRHLDGREVSVSPRKGKPMLINFWATWCGPCRIEWPVLQELYEKYKNDVDFFMMSPENAPVVREYVELNAYTAPVYVFSDESIAVRFAVKAFPVTYFVNARGKIEKSFVGFPATKSIAATRRALLDKYAAILQNLVTPPAKK